MIIKNGLVFTNSFQLVRLDLELRGDRIARIVQPGGLDTSEDDNVLDAQGLFVLPGLIDIHTHGALGHDWSDADEEANQKMLAFYASRGVTSVVPATMSYSCDILHEVLSAMCPLFETDGFGAVLRGVNMEGPFLSHAKKGAQNPKYLMDPDLAMFKELDKLCSGRIKLVDVAPELAGATEFIEAASKQSVVSLAHTAATYEQACAAFQAGASHVTHLFNGMAGYHHRDPGVVGAAMEYAAQVEVISDGMHLHPSVVLGAFKMFGAERICLISDSMRATGMPDGSYTLGGLEVFLRGGKAVLADDSLAGSAVDLAECCRRAISFGVPFEQAVRAASTNPARAVGLEGELGSIAPGLRADLLLWDMQYSTRNVIVGGNIFYL